MKRSIILAVFCLPVCIQVAGAYEYPLQFTPNAGHRGLVVAGYKFEGNTVVGTCSYYTVSGNGGGKGGGGRSPARKTYSQTCKWDMSGNLLSVTPNAPAAPTALYTNGTRVIYAVDANGNTTGTDTALPERGFVSAPGAHYTWLTPNTNAVVQQINYTLVIVLKSDGDVPLNVANVDAKALQGDVKLKSTTCKGQIDVGATCSIHITYDSAKLNSATGLAADTVRIDLTSDAGEPHDFIQNLTVIVRH